MAHGIASNTGNRETTFIDSKRPQVPPIDQQFTDRSLGKERERSDKRKQLPGPSLAIAKHPSRQTSEFKAYHPAQKQHYGALSFPDAFTSSLRQEMHDQINRGRSNPDLAGVQQAASM